MGFSRREYWSGFLCSTPGDIPNPAKFALGVSIFPWSKTTSCQLQEWKLRKALKHSLQVESTHWLLVTNRNYYNGFRHIEILLWTQGHLASPQEPQNIRAMPRPFMTGEEDHRGAVACPRSQNINDGKAGPRALATCQAFPGPPCTVEQIMPYATWGPYSEALALPCPWWSLLTTCSSDLGFALCKRRDYK